MTAGTPLPYLQAWRLKRHLSQLALAERIGVAAATVKNWERGRSSPWGPLRARTAEALGITCEELIATNPARPVRTRNPPIRPATVRFALDWYRRVS